MHMCKYLYLFAWQFLSFTIQRHIRSYSIIIQLILFYRSTSWLLCIFIFVFSTILVPYTTGTTTLLTSTHPESCSTPPSARHTMKETLLLCTSQISVFTRKSLKFTFSVYFTQVSVLVWTLPHRVVVYDVVIRSSHPPQKWCVLIDALFYLHAGEWISGPVCMYIARHLAAATESDKMVNFHFLCNCLTSSDLQYVCWDIYMYTLNN